MGIKWYHLFAFTSVILALAVFSMPRGRERGLMHLRSQEYKEAQPFLEEAVRKSPEDQTAFEALMTLYEKTGLRDRAATLLERYLECYPTDEKKRNDLIRLYLADHKIEEAIAVLEKAPRNRPTLLRLVELYEQMSFHEKAIAALKAMLVGDRRDDLLLQRMAQIEMWRGNLEGYEAAIAKRFSLNPTRQTAWDLFDFYFWQGRLSDAEGVVAFLERDEPADINILRAVLAFHLRQRNAEGTRRVARRIVTLPEAGPEDWLTYAQIEGWTGQPEKVLAILEEGERRFPSHEGIARAIAWEMFQQKRVEEYARRMLQLAEKTGREEDWRAVAFAYVDLQKIKEAYQILVDHLSPSEAALESLLLAGDLALRASHVTDALRWGREAASRLAKGRGSPEIARSVADLLLGAKVANEAIAVLEHASARWPEDSRLLLRLAQIQTDAGLYEESLATLDRLASFPSADRREIRFERARNRLELAWRASSADPGAMRDAAERAVQELEATLQDAENPDLRRSLVDLYLALGRPEEAERTAEPLKNVSAALWLAIASAYTSGGNFSKALLLLAQIEQMSGVDLVALRKERARSYLERVWRMSEGDPALSLAQREAIAAIETALADPGNDEFRLPLARLYLAQRKPEAAAEILRKLERLSPSEWIALAALAIDLEDIALAQEAMAHVARDADLGLAELKLAAYVQQKLGHPEVAARLYEKAHRLDPSDDAVLVTYADLLGQLGRRQEQYALFDQRARRGTVAAWLDAADRRLWAGDREGEDAVLAEALQIYPDAQPLLARRIRSLVATGHPREARALFARLREAPDVEVLRAQAVVLAELREREAARECYEAILRLRENDPEALLGLARIEVSESRYARSLPWYRRYLEQVKDDPWAWYEYGEALYEVGEDGARAQEKALALTRETRDLLTVTMHARIRYRQGRVQEALRLYAMAVGDPKAAPQTAEGYAYLLLDQGLIDQAEIVVGKLRKKYPGYLPFARLEAIIHLRKNRPQRAIELLTDLHRRDPDNGGVEAELAFAYDAKGAWEEARRYYAAAIRTYRRNE